MMFQHILVAADGSRHSQKAASAAINLASKMGSSTVTLMHVVSKAPTKTQLLDARFDVRMLLTEQAHQAIRQIEHDFRLNGIPFRLEVGLGDPAEEITAYAGRAAVDLIMIGSRGLSRLEELVLGSVSHKVVQLSPCPVMVVK
ncbi:universal stress protein [Brevibacillus humidisoli]|uniref:universal stress protein n=1 Tax=Brevibacillus humidisoli TaxID=2895522 RepID=UPI001E450782|nr:universal stress protein [Brevibacillus humidisoli]UFJ40737.1 universal stress protein [Brevibacillus humidisoli]